MTKQEPGNLRVQSASHRVCAAFAYAHRPWRAGQPFNTATATRSTTVIATLGPVFATAFPPGTDQGDTRARPEIWSDADKFKQAMDRYLAESNKLVDAAKSGNADTFRTQFGSLAKACDSCHDDFRKK